MTTPSHRRRAALAFAVGAAVPLLLLAAGTAPAFADEMGPSPVPGPSVVDPGYGPYLPPFTGVGPATDMIIVAPGAPAPDPFFLWNIYENVSTGGFSLAQQNPGYGWQQFSGPYATFADGGADMNALGVPGWEAF
jgi:hypothetical protein